MKQIPLAIGIDPAHTFDSFIAGANALALSHLRAMSPSVATASSTPAPVYLWGASGTGKTYLLRSLAQHWQEQGGRLGWFSAGDAAPWLFDEAWSLVIFDECERFDAAQQQSAFAMFVEATTAGVAVAAAGRLPPVDLPLRDDLRTRLGWGHVLALQPLGEAESRAALRREADRRGIFLSDDVMDYLLTRFARDLKHLMGLLDRLDEFALSHKRGVTVPLLKQMLAEQNGP
jgi:DnaA family protein